MIVKILALEISTAQGSVALLEDRQEPIAFHFRNDRKHSGAFFQSLHDVSQHIHKLDAIVVGLGPGSYAGVRIAIAAAIGLQAASGSRLLGLPSICAIDPAPNEYCVVGDARRNSFSFAHIRANEIVEGIHLYSEAELHARLKDLDSRTVVFSSENLPQFQEAIVRHPSALVLGKLVQRSALHASEAPLQPIYLREPHITIPNDKRNVSMLG
jgi:tRNA threonylcarbamoyl adenosine modification protein YeaZ